MSVESDKLTRRINAFRGIRSVPDFVPSKVTPDYSAEIEALEARIVTLNTGGVIMRPKAELAPTFTSLSPISGDDGQAVTIIGTGFELNATVKFTGSLATSIVVTSTSADPKIAIGSTPLLLTLNGFGQLPGLISTATPIVGSGT